MTPQGTEPLRDAVTARRVRRAMFGALALIALVLAEERRPSIFQSAPQLRAVALRIEPVEWRRAVSHQWAAVAGEYQRRLLTAQDHVRRKMRNPY